MTPVVYPASLVPEQWRGCSRAESDGRRHRRLPLGAARHAGARPRQVRVGVASSASCSSSPALVYFRRVERTFADVDLMPIRRHPRRRPLASATASARCTAATATLRERIAAAGERARCAASTAAARRGASGRCATSRFEVAQGEVSASSAATAPARRRCSRSCRGSRADRRAAPTIRGRVGSAARGRHRLPPRADRPREHLPERRDPRHAARARSRASSTRSSSSPGSSGSSTRP